ncbi:MAG: (d)CMP kinase [Alphaproteobacteria bacterium]
MIVAIDGPAAAGKGTLARRLAAHLGFAYLDTGRLYRAVGMAVLRAGGDPADPAAAARAAKGLSPADLDDPALKGDDAAVAASKVAAISCVRAALLRFQQDFARQPPGGAAGAVLDGRDIGTVVCPDAEVKLFVDAGVEVRAERRHRELLARGEASIYSRVLQEMRDRDARDRDRSVAPLMAAEDAFVLDTSGLDADQAFAAALDYVQSRRP